MRSFKQTREVSISLGRDGSEDISAEADGTARVSMGQTSVMTSVHGPAQPKYSRHEDPQKATLEVELVHASSSSLSYSEARETQNHFRLTENIRRTLAASLQLDRFPRLLILVKIVVLQDDGALFSTVVNACSLALLDASLPMRFYVSAADVALCGSLNDETVCLLDPTLQEETNAQAVLSAVYSSPSESTVNQDKSRKDGMLMSSEVRGSCSISALTNALDQAAIYAAAMNQTMRQAIHSKLSSS